MRCDVPDRAMHDFNYKVAWRARGLRQGFHASTHQGSGMEFVAHMPLSSGADPRRVDILASLASPASEWLARVHRSSATLPVCVLLDLSGSMAFCGVRNKLDVVRQFVQSASLAALRTGDAFGLVAADDEIREDLWIPVSHARSVVRMASERLRDIQVGRGATGLIGAVSRLPRTRALVFLVSDFHLPLDLLASLLDATAHHDVVPIVIWDVAEGARPRWGLIEFVDPESGRRRTLLMRPSLHSRWRNAQAARRKSLHDCFARYQRRAFVVDGAFDPDAMTRYFLGDDAHLV